MLGISSNALYCLYMDFTQLDTVRNGSLCGSPQGPLGPVGIVLKRKVHKVLITVALLGLLFFLITSKRRITGSLAKCSLWCASRTHQTTSLR